jgi:hypothetical protein
MKRQIAMLAVLGGCIAVVLGAPAVSEAAKGLTLTNAVVDLEASPATVELHELDDRLGTAEGRVWQMVDGKPEELVVRAWTQGSLEVELASSAPGDYLLTVLVGKRNLGFFTLTVPARVEAPPVPLPVAQGGTGAEDAEGARSNLGVAAGPHTTDTDTTCDGEICNGAGFTHLQWQNLENLPTSARGDLLVHDGTGVVRLPAGSDGQVLVADSSQPTGLRWADAAGTCADTTVRDDFFEQSFGNNDGPDEWSGEWVEDDVAGPGPGAGNVSIWDGLLRLRDYADTGTQPSAARSVDLSGTLAATLSFGFHTTSGVDTSDAVVVEVSSDGGVSFTLLETITELYGATEGSRVYDITAFASAETTVRFRVTNLYGGDSEFFEVDYVEISAGCAG